jgi:Ion channel
VTAPGGPGPGEDAGVQRRIQGVLAWLRGDDAALSLFLLMLMTSTFVEWPLRGLVPEWFFDVSLVVTLVLGVVVVAPTPRLAVLAGILALAVAVERLTIGPRPTVFRSALPLAFFALIDAALLARVFRPGRISVHRLLGAVALFVVLGVTWGLAFQLLDLVSPGSILAGGRPATTSEAMWLSFATLTTVGYGDVLPVTLAGKAMAAVEALTGVLYPSVLIGFLLSDYARARPAGRGTGPP